MLLRNYASPSLVTDMDYTPIENTQNLAIVRLINKAKIVNYIIYIFILLVSQHTKVCS